MKNLLDGIHAAGLSPVKIWADSMPDQARIVFDILIQAGTINSAEDALSYLIENVNCNISGNLTVCDISADSSLAHKFLRRLKKIQGQIEVVGSANWRFHGIKGHQAIPALLNGELDERLQNSALISRASILLKTLLPAINSKNTCFFQDRTGMLEEFYGMAKQIFKEFATDLMVKINRQDDFFLLLQTMASWVRALLWYLSLQQEPAGPPALFTEVQSLPRNHGISGGIIDAILVNTIGGKKVDPSQNQILRQLSRKKPASVVRLCEVASRIFSKNSKPARLGFIIRDWKFPVGDAIPTFTDHSPLLTIDQIKLAPLGKHKLQMMRYLALSSLGLHLSLGHDPQNWAEKAQFTRGELVYVMPEQIITHTIKATSEDLRQFILTQIVPKLGFAKSQALLRETNNAVLGHLILMIGNGKQAARCLPKENRQPLLFELNGNLTALEAIEGLRTFVDPWRIIEQVNEKYHLHYGRLLDAIASEDARPGRGFSAEEGGFVQCIFPDHADTKTPSFKITTQLGSFFCFGCERGGKIKPHSVPANLNIDFSHNANDCRRLHRLQKGATSPPIIAEHEKIMLAAQEILQRNFYGSAGEKYLQEKRRVDPDLAYILGIGFGTPALINDLLDAGYSYDQLLFYGFASVSQRVSSSFGLTPLLRHRGLAISDIRRECGKDKVKNPIYGFPYSTLSKRISFPLGTAEGKINSFYGRAASPELKLAHFIFSNKNTKIPHGIFNAAALSNCVDQNIIMAEAGIDTLSLIQIGRWLRQDYEHVFGIIGVLNYHVISELIRARINGLAIAFDLDPSKINPEGKEIGQTGQRKTAKFIEQLQKHGVRYSITNFTENFYRGYSELEPAKDWNELLVRIKP